MLREKIMKHCFLSALIIVALAVLPAISCAAAPAASTTPPKPPVVIKKPDPKPPVIKDILGPKEAAVSSKTQFTCWAVDPDGRKMTYEWTAEAGTITANGAKEGYWDTPAKPGAYKISVKVTNDAGLTDNMSKTFEVVPMPETHKYVDNTIYLKLPMPGSAPVRVEARSPVTSIVEIQCIVEGRDSSQLKFIWTAPISRLSGNGLAEGKASRVGWIAPGTPGQYAVSVTVTDESGSEAKGEVTIDVFAQ